MDDAAHREPAPDRRRLVGGRGAQSMINSECGDPAATRSRPAVGEKGKGQAVGAAGDAYREMRRRLERAEPLEALGKITI